MKGTKTVITILRMAIGWHLLYEGISKLWGHWTAASYLNNAQGFMASSLNVRSKELSQIITSRPCIMITIGRLIQEKIDECLKCLRQIG